MKYFLALLGLIIIIELVYIKTHSLPVYYGPAFGPNDRPINSCPIKI